MEELRYGRSSVASFFIPNPIGTAGYDIYPLLRRFRGGLWGFSFVPAMVRALIFQFNFSLLTAVALPGGVPTKTVCANTAGGLCIQLTFFLLGHYDRCVQINT